MSWLKIYVTGLAVTPVFVGLYYHWEAFYDSILAGQPPNLTSAIIALVPGTDPVPRRRRLRIATAFAALIAGWGWPLYW